MHSRKIPDGTSRFSNTNRRAQLLVDALRIQGVDTIFCVPGESFLSVLDALRDAKKDIGLIVCRHEGAAANMAEAYGKLTGAPGICIVSRGPGATHASIGVHTAQQDSTPMILLIGQIEREFAGRESFQEVDYRFMSAPPTKWVAEIDRASRVPELVSRAFQTAVSGGPGPVALALTRGHVGGDRCSRANQTLHGRTRASGSSGFASTECHASPSTTPAFAG
jgi:acetolactate synthase I/II/III large subunit